MLLIGKNVKPGVIGGLVPAGRDLGAGAFDSRTGMLSANGDVPPDARLRFGSPPKIDQGEDEPAP